MGSIRVAEVSLLGFPGWSGFAPSWRSADSSVHSWSWESLAKKCQLGGVTDGGSISDIAAADSYKGDSRKLFEFDFLISETMKKSADAKMAVTVSKFLAATRSGNFTDLATADRIFAFFGFDKGPL